MQNDTKIKIIKASTQSIIGILTVLGMFYLLIQNVEIPTLAWYTIMIVIASVYGFDSIAALLEPRKREK